MSSSNKPSIRAYIGTTGSGKGVSADAHLKEIKPARLFVWDPQGEWGHLGRTYGERDLGAAIKAMQAPAFKVVYQPGGDQREFAKRYDLVCRAVYQVGDLTFMPDELADVTTASWAPPAWRRICTSGRHRKLSVIGHTQRPAFIDKAFLGNCTYVRCFALREAPDKKRMALALSVPYDVIDGLETVEDEVRGVTTIKYYERDFRSGERGENTMVLKRRK